MLMYLQHYKGNYSYLFHAFKLSIYYDRVKSFVITSLSDNDIKIIPFQDKICVVITSRIDNDIKIIPFKIRFELREKNRRTPSSLGGDFLSLLKSSELPEIPEIIYRSALFYLLLSLLYVH